MICQTCKESGVLNSACGKQFYYCKTCKCEINLEVQQFNGIEFLDNLNKFDISKIFEELKKTHNEYDQNLHDEKYRKLSSSEKTNCKMLLLQWNNAILAWIEKDRNFE
jgi:hypothetical protein